MSTRQWCVSHQKVPRNPSHNKPNTMVLFATRTLSLLSQSEYTIHRNQNEIQ